MSIVVDKITKTYGEQKALNEVSFEIKPGVITGFLGPNGAGKSTMMKILTGFIPPSSGEAFVCGFPIEEQSMEVRRRIGYLPEHNPLYLEMYVKEFLMFIGGIYKVNNLKKRVEEMIEVTGLQVEQNKKIGALSKGYRQRVGLAQAIIHDPEVLILDEPTTGLDPNQLVEIRNLIKQLGKEKTLMFSSHILPEVQEVCDRIIIINKGVIMMDDDAVNIRQRNKSQQQFIVEFDKEVNPSLLMKIRGVKQAGPQGNNTLQLYCESDVRAELFQWAVDHQLKVLTLRSENQSLEDLFRELTHPQLGETKKK
jgi:ABC-2 type transport system ATP-binding protein